MASERRRLEELNLLDNFLFGTMVTHPDYGEAFSRHLLRLILNREIGKLKVVSQSVYFGSDPDQHGATMIFLNTKGNPDDESEELCQFLRYAECSTPKNAITDELWNLHQMVDSVKHDEEVSVRYMRLWESEESIRRKALEEGQALERINTEKEKARADEAEARADEEKAKTAEEKARADEAERKVAELQAIIEGMKIVEGMKEVEGMKKVEGMKEVEGMKIVKGMKEASED